MSHEAFELGQRDFENIHTVLLLRPILILVPVRLLLVFLGIFRRIQRRFLVKLAVLLDVGIVVVVLGNLVEMYRVQNPAFE